MNKFRLLAGGLALWVLCDCSQHPQTSAKDNTNITVANHPEENLTVKSTQMPPESLAVESLIQQRELPFPLLKASELLPIKREKEVGEKVELSQNGTVKFKIQLGAEEDYKTALQKKNEFERKIGSTVEMLFESPYYKLRTGKYETKKEAEERRLELKGLGLDEMLVVKE